MAKRGKVRLGWMWRTFLMSELRMGALLMALTKLGAKLARCAKMSMRPKA